ncbi:hypothetical protein VOLCADRAFT_89964 [Volvox carteri f. nagariensis]|uniref:Uncharacterized protein n=1 Tax=Volvox carteri f. nagariensis TaxID=3068 RepID=D8TT46_VOLCA|nr:uncharacterized protein VOLCADRAFT_89964 [Volvox carteri f. nagariensis]EFJ49247.1 hypothetical protein VOLCADRAFT_89964 [Volvox carteri f. nagariensis]|eukprot:XP_002949695.1 hypothetical protein VOLCADRAFT_89964 [Volvox carteri f. nagariensis]
MRVWIAGFFSGIGIWKQVPTKPNSFDQSGGWRDGDMAATILAALLVAAGFRAPAPTQPPPAQPDNTQVETKNTAKRPAPGPAEPAQPRSKGARQAQEPHQAAGAPSRSERVAPEGVKARAQTLLGQVPLDANPMIEGLALALASEAHKARASSTVAQYKEPWQEFLDWAELLHIRASDVYDIRPEIVAMYLMHVYQTAQADEAGPGRVARATAAIACHFFFAGRPSPTEHPACKLVRDLSRRTLSKTDQECKGQTVGIARAGSVACPVGLSEGLLSLCSYARVPSSPSEDVGRLLRRVKATQQGQQLQQRTGSVQSPISSLSSNLIPEEARCHVQRRGHQARNHTTLHAHQGKQHSSSQRGTKRLICGERLLILDVVYGRTGVPYNPAVYTCAGNA